MRWSSKLLGFRREILFAMQILRELAVLLPRIPESLSEEEALVSSTDRFVKPPPAKICRETRNPKVGVVSPSAAAPSCRLLQIFYPRSRVNMARMLVL